MRSGAFAVLIALSSAALAQGTDIGLVNLVSGDVSYSPSSGPSAKVRSFMTVREGDRFSLPAGAQIRVVFYEGARQERWVGPASFRVKKGAGELIAGKPAEVVVLPSGVQRRIARVPDLIQNAKLGGITVRSALRPPPSHTSQEQRETISASRVTYAHIQKEMPADDITPELYLYAALEEYRMYDEMKAVVAEMRRKQPGNEDLMMLETWVTKQASH